MAQVGIHGILGVVARRWMPAHPWLFTGVVLGNLFPDLDNLAVAVATVTGGTTEGLHRTFTHSLFTVLALVVAGYVVAWVAKRSQWGNLGLGLGVGVLMHILLDLLIWFDGVEILWPLSSRVDIWQGVTPPLWWSQLMMPAEFLFFALFFLLLAKLARQQGGGHKAMRTLRSWTIIQMALFVIFTPLVFLLKEGFIILYGAFYLLSLAVAIWMTIRMGDVIEGMNETPGVESMAV